MPRRYAAKVDDNQAEIVEALRKMGASVQSLAAVGNGVPDLVVGLAGKNYLLEVKDPTADTAARRSMNPAQARWHSLWKGTVHVVHSPSEAELVVNGGTSPGVAGRDVKRALADDDRVWDILRRHGETTAPRVSEITGLTKWRVGQAFARLVTQGKATLEKTNKGYVYRDRREEDAGSP